MSLKRPADALTTSSSDDEVTQSPQAELSCIACKRLKRRCSKGIPTCALCKKVGRRCDYPTGDSTPSRSTAASAPDPGGRLTRIKTPAPLLSYLQPPPSAFANPVLPKLASCFLDSVATRGADVPLAPDLTWHEICPGAETIDPARVSAIFNAYFGSDHFESMHSWFPVGVYLFAYAFDRCG